jgi:carotenoid cleavage dioxygenase
LWVIEADDVEKGPIAKVRTGLALRSQVHGSWVDRDRLETSKVKG